MVDLLKRTMKDSFSELAALVPAQPVPQTSQAQEIELNLPGPSAASTPLPPSGRPARDSPPEDLSGIRQMSQILPASAIHW